MSLCDVLKVGHVAIFRSTNRPEVKPIWPIATNWEGELLTSEEIFNETVALKEIFPKMKIVLKVTNQRGQFNDIIAMRKVKEMLRIKSQLHEYVRDYGFDGIDFELQRFPVVREFSQFLEWVRKEMKNKIISFTGDGLS